MSNYVVSLNAGSPSSLMSNEEWQEYFAEMKTLIHPLCQKRMSCTPHGVPASEKDRETARYASYINGILSTIRSGHEDYCYLIYQIADLLKFEFSDLRTEYIQEDGYFRVWLSSLYSPS